MDVKEAIERAESLLPGESAPPKESDPRWQAIIAIEEYIPTDPDAVWEFIRTWGCHQQEDIRDSIATCLLEHLLESHFSKYFSQVEQIALTNANFADTFLRCWKFGQSGAEKNSFQFDDLQKRLLVKD